MVERIGITDKEISLWEKDLKRGLKMNDLVKKYKRDWSVIQNAITTKDKRKFRCLTLKERELIKNDFKRGLSVYKIAKKRKHNIGVIYYTIKKVSELKRINAIREYEDKINQLSLFDIGYICAIIDGEGCVYANMDKNNRIRVGISISNRNKKIIDFINKLMGFNTNIHHFNRKIKQVNHHKLRNNWGKIYEWKTNDKRALRILLNKLYLYMIGKRMEMYYMLKIIDTRNKKEMIDYAIKLQRVKMKHSRKIKQIKSNIPFGEVIELK